MSTSRFELARGFDQGTTSGALELGPLAASYAQLFADALQDGSCSEAPACRCPRT